MSIEATAEQDAIIARAKVLFGGRVHDELPDDETLARDENLNVKPYAVVAFGELYDSVLDRSITGEEQQPAIMPVIFECWSTSSSVCRSMAGAIRGRFRGWSAGDNMSPLRFRGGGAFLQRDSNGGPSRFQRTVTMETLLNMSFDDSSVPPVDPIDPVTPIAPSLRYDFVQSLPSAEWVIPHAFGRKPAVTVRDLSDHEFLADVTATSTLVTVRHNSPRTGTVTLN